MGTLLLLVLLIYVMVQYGKHTKGQYYRAKLNYKEAKFGCVSYLILLIITIVGAILALGLITQGH